MAVWLLGILLFAPFHLSYEGSVGFPFVERHDFATPLYQYLAVHGIFLFISISYLLYRLWQEYSVKLGQQSPECAPYPNPPLSKTLARRRCSDLRWP